MNMMKKAHKMYLVPPLNLLSTNVVISNFYCRSIRGGCRNFSRFHWIFKQIFGNVVSLPFS